MTRRGHLHLLDGPDLADGVEPAAPATRTPGEAHRLAAMAGHPAGVRRRGMSTDDALVLRQREAAMARHPAGSRHARAAARTRHPAGRQLATPGTSR